MQHAAGELISEIRVFYNSLVRIGEDLHTDAGITLGARAVLEFLQNERAQTVPRIADARRVTRQRIQSIVNELKEQKLVKSVTNPSSQRSPLITPTRKGEALISAMRVSEAALLQNLSVGDRQIKNLASQLKKIRTELEASAEKNNQVD
jgi:DNA-binding MarR family transcriptional regulator